MYLSKEAPHLSNNELTYHQSRSVRSWYSSNMEAFKNTKEDKISSLGKIVRLLSSLYLLPLYISDKSAKMYFSFFSCKTLTFFFIISLPTILLMILVGLQIDYYTEVVNTLYKIYNDIDIFAMSFVLFFNCMPFPIFFVICMSSRIWASVPELSMNTYLMLPRKFKTSVVFFLQMSMRKEENKADQDIFRSYFHSFFKKRVQ